MRPGRLARRSLPRGPFLRNSRFHRIAHVVPGVRVRRRRFRGRNLLGRFGLLFLALAKFSAVIHGGFLYGCHVTAGCAPCVVRSGKVLKKVSTLPIPAKAGIHWLLFAFSTRYSRYRPARR